jgi:hypothetical protein
VPGRFHYEDWRQRPLFTEVETTPLLQGLVWPQATLQCVEAEFRQTALRRATLIQLALRAYRKDHGRWPSQLKDLAEKYLSPFPVDPYSGQMFWYFPHGRSEITRWGVGLEWKLPGRKERVREVAPGEAFLWSAGPAMPGAYYVSPDGQRQYLIQDDHGNQFRPVSEAEALARGWAFPLENTESDPSPR